MNTIRLLKRYASIVSVLDSNDYIPKEELIERVRDACDKESVDIRTLQRDFKAIDELFGIEIKNIRNKGYRIVDRLPLSNVVYGEFQKFLMFAQLGENSFEVILPDHRRMTFSIDFTLVIKAIRQQQVVEFEYKYFREEGKTREKNVEPYYLKESQQRWYLVAKDTSDRKMKCFELGRVENFRVLEKKFHRDDSLNIPALFKDSFGIWNNPDDPVEDVELEFDTLDGSFIKTLPLHSSQRVVSEDANNLRVSMRLRITNDFVMALLSRSRSVRVINPLHLKERICQILATALERNRIDEI